MQQNFLNIIAILIASFLIIIFILNIFKSQKNMIEGLTNADGTITSVPTPSSGVAGTAASYAAAIKANLIKLQDELLVSKYRKDYESAIINLDDYVGMLMIKQVLNMNVSGDVKSNIDAFNNLNTLKTAKESLNTTMAFLDKQ